MIKLGLNGASGRMCSAIEKLASTKKDYKIVSKITSTSSKADIVEAFKVCDVILDFSSAEGFESITSFITEGNAKLLVGTTGLKQEHLQKLYDIGKTKAVLYAPNTSLGATLISYLASKAASLLTDYDIEIIDTHHRLKKDAPSGTALMIGEEIAKAKNMDLSKHAVFNRSQNGQRKDNEIGFSSIRAGGIYGDHEVLFANDDEIISLGYRAINRDAFANGALFAAKWLKNQNIGFYSMVDVFLHSSK